MSVNPIAASAVGNAGVQLIQKGAKKAMESLPKEKQNTVLGIVMVVGAAALIVAGIRLMRKNSTAVGSSLE